MSFNISTLLNTMGRKEYLKACALTKKECDTIAQMEDLPIVYNPSKKPGETLVKLLDTRGYSLQDYEKLLNTVKSMNLHQAYYKPSIKVAILIANQSYEQLDKLITPLKDCQSLGALLTNLGFIVIIIKDTKSNDLKEMLSKTISMIPEDSYCFIFYAGHGCEMCNVCCMLGVECPPEDLELQHCVTDTYVLQEMSKCKPNLGILIVDSCRVRLDRAANPKIYSNLADVGDFDVHKYLTIVYSTKASASAYEIAQFLGSTLIDENVTYNPQTGDTDKLTPESSQYMQALSNRINEDLDISSILDKVHEDLESASKKQIAIKIQYGAAKRSLCDPVTGNPQDLFEKLSKFKENYNKNYFVFNKYSDTQMNLL